jgi:hypothetical protein
VSAAVSCASAYRPRNPDCSGALGRAVLEHALAGGRYAGVSVLTRAPLQSGLRGLYALAHDTAADTPIAAETVVIVFDRGRDFHGRDAAYHLPEPAELPRLAHRLRDGGARTLVVMEPVAPSLLPQALQHGLATLDEHALVACGFERLLFVRPTQDAAAAVPAGAPQRLARWMLSQLRYMIPAREQPVRADSVAAFVFEVLRRLPDQRRASGEGLTGGDAGDAPVWSEEAPRSEAATARRHAVRASAGAPADPAGRRADPSDGTSGAPVPAPIIP